MIVFIAIYEHWTFLILIIVRITVIFISFGFFISFLLLSLKVFKKSFDLLDLNRYLLTFVMLMKNCLPLIHIIMIVTLAITVLYYH